MPLGRDFAAGLRTRRCEDDAIYVHGPGPTIDMTHMCVGKSVGAFPAQSSRCRAIADQPKHINIVNTRNLICVANRGLGGLCRLGKVAAATIKSG